MSTSYEYLCKFRSIFQVSRLSDRWSVNTSNADLKVRSSDGVEFDLHRAVLAVHTGAFPGPEVGTSGEVLELTEPADVLRICFDFMHPKRHPDLEDIEDFGLLVAVAEAVGKYEIFPAINICNMRLRSFLAEYHTEILLYAIKHDYSKLINEATPYLARSPFTSALKQLPSSYAIAWFQYRDAWTAVFKDAINKIGDLSSSSSLCKCLPPIPQKPDIDNFGMNFDMSYQHVRIPPTPSANDVCYTCKCSLLTWITFLEDIKYVSILKATIQEACDKGATTKPFTTCCSFKQVDSSPQCIHLVDVAQLCRTLIQEIPPFNTFVTEAT